MVQEAVKNRGSEAMRRKSTPRQGETDTMDCSLGVDGNTAEKDGTGGGGSASVLLPEMLVPGCIITLLDQKAPVGIVLLILNERVSDMDRLQSLRGKS